MSPKKAVKSKSEWLERVVAIERVTKVVKGGKKMSFRAIIVVGNEQGKVGVGVGKVPPQIPQLAYVGKPPISTVEVPAVVVGF